MKTKTIKFKISGMHCTACALNIDFDLEDLPGVVKSTTHYAKSETAIEFDPTITSPVELKSQISKTGYICECEIQSEL